MEREPIAAGSAILLTPRPSAGGSAIAVVRIRGEIVQRFLESRFSAGAATGKCVHGELRDGTFVVDDCVVMLDPNGAFADICLHGGAWVIERAMKLMAGDGFAVIDPALPLADAALDNAGSEIDREMLRYLPLALTAPAIRMLMNQARAWVVNGRINALPILRDRTLWRHLHPATVAIVGQPNVGKSTLANRLFGQQRSITADLPGTTRDWVGEMADIGGVAVMLIDTPGIRATDDPVERAAISASAAKIRTAHLRIEVLDASAAEPKTMPKNAGRRVVVMNKIDQAAAWNVAGAVKVSAKTGEGMEDLCRAIHLKLRVQIDEKRMGWWTRRQRMVLRGTVVRPSEC
jgi:tRNA modification GTPase